MSERTRRNELMAERTNGGLLELRSPDVGTFSGAFGEGATLSPGMTCGTLRSLGRDARLVVPDGVSGAIVSTAPRALAAPVEFGEVLYVLDPEGAPLQAVQAGAATTALEGDQLAVTASQAGRIWHSPSPDAPPFCSPGDVVEDGAPLCLVEVMKTFATLPYRVEGGLPARARVVRWIAMDGADVAPGSAILAVEPT